MSIIQYAKVAGIGFIGAAFGLGAANLAAQSGSGGTIAITVDSQGRVWQAHGNQIRYCISDSRRPGVWDQIPECSRWR